MKIICTKEWQKWDEEQRINIEKKIYLIEDAIRDALDFNTFINNPGANKNYNLGKNFFVRRFVYRKIQFRLLLRYISDNNVELHYVYRKNYSNNAKEYRSPSDQGIYIKIFKEYIKNFKEEE